MKWMMVFHASGVDANSVGSHDAGTNLDLAAFDVADYNAWLVLKTQ